ncbi:Rid family hydrolase [Paraburkholderia madseniana]|uniref:Rid family hydrolase n=2 Tax=Paraburkholderia TaxID=1822464 RepID=A0AAP5EYQ3_9BURK|nr:MULTISPECIES: Rid family hydrolase [Paraburkholderia]MCX4148859.1 Rid family hydrolase [Paraburkholderia madseniana]MDN7151797.1 Rid family hydrolase [Paraburkholderia sp. WS6]MDQ6410677.1 Rid family hydrolase [Paraburkholderia madseniana]
MMRAINPAGQSIPQTSQAMLVSGDNLLFISGQVAYGAEGVIGSDLETQLNEAFKNLQTVLHEAGATFEHVVRLTIYVVDYDQSMLPTIRSVRGRYVNMERPPASTLLGVSALFLPGVLAEVEAVATISR